MYYFTFMLWQLRNAAFSEVPDGPLISNADIFYLLLNDFVLQVVSERQVFLVLDESHSQARRTLTTHY